MRRRTALTIRDVALLRELLERRSETTTYLADTFFRGVRKTARNRLRELELGGFVSRQLVETFDRPGRLQSVYTLGPAARTALRIRSAHADEAFGTRRFNPILRETSIPHQVATNRVGDWLGARLIPEHLLPVHQPGAQRHRPDAIYRAAAADSAGRQLVFLEVDLGHYNRQRILGKVDAFLAHEHARSILFVCPTPERAAVVSGWIREQYGEGVMDRIQPLSFDQVREGGWLDPGTEPSTGEDADRTAA
jgi:hypothetical protein